MENTYLDFLKLLDIVLGVYSQWDGGDIEFEHHRLFKRSDY
jgi:hypothetical protein